LHLFDFAAPCIVLLAQPLLRSSQRFFPLLLQPRFGFRNLLLKLFQRRAEVLPHALADFVREATRPLFNRLQFLSYTLPEIILTFRDFLLNGDLRRFQDLFRMLTRLLRNLSA
jgi:hypothetical protein